MKKHYAALAIFSFFSLQSTPETKPSIPPHNVDAMLKKSGINPRGFGDVTYVNIESDSIAVASGSRDPACLYFYGAKLIECMACREKEEYIENFHAMNLVKQKRFLASIIKTFADYKGFDQRFTKEEWTRLTTGLSGELHQFLLPTKDEQEVFIVQFIQKANANAAAERNGEIISDLGTGIVLGISNPLFGLCYIMSSIIMEKNDDYEKRELDYAFAQLRKKIVED